MKTRFGTLFTLDITHEYYGGPCKDFEFVAAADGQRLMKNCKLLFRALNGGLRVLFQADETGAPINSAAGQTLRVGIKLLNPMFCNFTQNSPDPGSAVAVYRNSVSPSALALPDVLTPVSARFRHELSNAARPVQVTLTDPGNVAGPPQKR